MFARKPLFVFLLGSLLLAPGRAVGADAGPPPVESMVLTDNVALDELLGRANDADPATRAAAVQALEGIQKNNPSGRRWLSFAEIRLQAPSWSWDYNRKLGIQGVSLDRVAHSDGDIASVLVDHLPGLSGEILGNTLQGLPDGAKVTKTEVTSVGRLTGKGTREIVLVPGPSPQRIECVLFFPEKTLRGCYVFTVFSGPAQGDPIEAELNAVVQSIGKR